MTDLMDNDDAAAAVKRHAPALYAACQDHNSETRVMTPAQATYVAHLDRQAIQELDTALKRVSV